MYILVNKSRMIMGLFSTHESLDMAIKVLKESGESRCYYVEVSVDDFDSILFNFWTMHPEKLNEVIL